MFHRYYAKAMFVNELDYSFELDSKSKMSLNQWHLVVQGTDEQSRWGSCRDDCSRDQAPPNIGTGSVVARSSCSTLQTPSAMIISIAINKGMKYVVYPARNVYEVSFLDELQETWSDHGHRHLLEPSPMKKPLSWLNILQNLFVR